MNGLLLGAVVGAMLLAASLVALPQPAAPAVSPTDAVGRTTAPVSPSAPASPAAGSANAATAATGAASGGAAGGSTSNAGAPGTQTTAPAACPSARQSVAGLTQAAGNPSLGLSVSTPIVPSGQMISVTVPDTLDRKTRLAAVVTISQHFSADSTQDLAVIGVQPVAGAATPTTLIQLAGIPDSKLGFLGFPRYTLQVVACGPGDVAPRWGQASGAVSEHLFATLAALLLTTLFYIAGAWAKPMQSGGARRLSPIRLATDGSGRASLSQMQIIYFSVIVLFLVTYILLRTGQLANLSNDVLLLLGIAAAGSVAGTVATTNRQRLTFDNWAWAMRKGWFAASGNHVDQPRWSDLITSDGDFDPYRFQMLSFSVVVGIALLFSGLNGLDSFSIPPALQGVLGLSQVAYVGGKVIAQGTFGELDTQLTALRQAEQEFISAAAPTWLPAVPPPPPPAPPAAVLATDAARAAYIKFKMLIGPAWTMFQQLIPVQGSAPGFEPSL